MKLRTLTIVFGISLLFAVQPAMAQLTPPAGPVADSFKNLDEVEPRIPLSQETTPGDVFNEFIINAPGSYYFTRSVTTAKNKLLRIDTTGDVTVDLQGFTLTQTPAMNEVIDIRANVGICTIRNGSIAEGGLGIFARGPITAPDATLVLEGLSIKNPFDFGVLSNRTTTIRDSSIRNTGGKAIFLGGKGSVIERTQISDIAIAGAAVSGALEVVENARVTDVTITDVNGTALIVGSAANIRGLTVANYGIAGSAVDGLILSQFSILSHSTFTNYAGTGSAIRLDRNIIASVLTVNEAFSGTGITMGTSSTLVDSYIDGTGIVGVSVGSWCVVKRNSIEHGGIGDALVAVSQNVIDENRFFGNVSYAVNNVVTRNTIDNGTFTANGAGNSVGPLNDLTSPWTNFVK